MKMKKSLSESRFTLRILDYLEEIKKGENNVVLFGSVGNGKTYLLNKACGANFLTSDEGYSCTRNVQYSFSLKYDMVIIDFPGLNSVKDMIGHLKIQRTALSAIPIRMICFVIKYSQRNDDFEIELSQMLSIFDNYKKNIAIIITKSEEINNNMKRKEEIKFLFKNKFEIENVLFTTKKTAPLELCKNLNSFKSKMENIKQLLIKTRDLAKTVPSLYNKDMAKERQIYEDKFYDTLDLFKKEVDKASDPDLKRALYFACKDFKDFLLEEYTNVIKRKKIDGKEPDLDSIIAEILMFDNNIYNEFNEFRKQIESTIKISSTTYNGEYNRFKKCPHCGTIWFKVIGCNSVQCGKRTNVTDKIIGRYKKYKVSFKDNKIFIQTEDLGNGNNIEMNSAPMNMNNMMINNNIMMNNNIMNNNNMMNMNNMMINSYIMNNNMEMNSTPMNMNNMMMNSNPINNNNMMNMNNMMMNSNPINNNYMMNMNNNMNQNSNLMEQQMMMLQMMQMQQMIQLQQRLRLQRNNMDDIENDNEFFGLTEKEMKENEERKKKGKIQINPLGCGREINWNEMEDCSDEVIEKLKEIAIDDYHSGLLKISDEMNKK